MSLFSASPPPRICGGCMAWMAGTSPRLSGSAGGERKSELSRASRRDRSWLGEATDRPSMHEVGADGAGEGERGLDDNLSLLRQAQEQEGDERHGELDADGVLAAAEEPPDLKGLLDPAEEQLDLPAALVERRDFLGGGGRGGCPGGEDRY